MKLKKTTIALLGAIASLFSISSASAVLVTFEFDEFTAFDGFASGSPATSGGSYTISEIGGNGINAVGGQTGPFADDGGFLFTGPPAAGVNGSLGVTVTGGPSVQFSLVSVDLFASSGSLIIDGLDATGAVIFTVTDSRANAADDDFAAYSNPNPTLVSSLRISSTTSDNGNRIDSIVLDIVPEPIPEPSSTALLGIGLAGLVLRRRR